MLNGFFRTDFCIKEVVASRQNRKNKENFVFFESPRKRTALFLITDYPVKYQLISGETFVCEVGEMMLMPQGSRYAASFELPENVSAEDAKAILAAYKDVYDETQDKSAWFDTVKSICEPLGFCPEVKEYKKNPEGWKGHAGDVSTVIRLAVTGRRNTPDLCAIMQLLGRARVMARLDAAMNK